MRAQIDNYILADGVTSHISGFDDDVEPTIQEDRPIHSLAAKFRYRGNQTTTITFTVARLHKSLRAGFVFLLTHGPEVPKQGLITFSVTDETGQSARYLVDGVLSRVGSSWKGATTFHRYQMRGGIVTDQKTG